MNIAFILTCGHGNKFMNQTNKVSKNVYEDFRTRIACRVIDTFQKHPDIDKIVIITDLEYVKKTEDVVKLRNFDKVMGVVSGGISQEASVNAGILFLNDSEHYVSNANIIIHDASRINITKNDISLILEAMQNHEAVSFIKAVSRKTVTKTEDNFIDKNLDKNDLYTITSPQGFKLDRLRTAHNFALDLNQRFDDETSLMKLVNVPTYLLVDETSHLNTYTEMDLLVAEFLLQN